MPNIGDEIRGKEIGKEGHNAERVLYVWVKCPHCLEERWAQKKSPLNNKSRLCLPCNKNNASTFNLHPIKPAKEGLI
jgi:formylmethanofuran dehydrogenase subunit E